jgi:endonuclease YncB( thermonuclease family)
MAADSNAQTHRRQTTIASTVLAALSLLPTLLPPTSGRADLRSYARVQEDGSLRVGTRRVRLYGVYLPPTGYTCDVTFRPRFCGSRAAIALNLKIGPKFVRCEEHWRNEDRSIAATCYIDGDDLAAYLLELGWAVATPDAPFQYIVLERIARSRQVGVWGFPADAFQRRRHR